MEGRGGDQPHFVEFLCDREVVVSDRYLSNQCLVCHVVVAIIARVVPVVYHTTPNSATLPPVVWREREFARDATGAVSSVHRLETIGCGGCCSANRIWVAEPSLILVITTPEIFRALHPGPQCLVESLKQARRAERVSTGLEREGNAMSTTYQRFRT
jgi:hypothetical protein